MRTEKGVKRDYLWIVLFLIIFINGFEAGGYQASLWSVGKDFDLSATSMGLYAAMELFATMLAPILLGRWADSVRKDKSISLLLVIQFAAAMAVLFTSANRLFLICIFFLGLTTSALQFIAIAALADAYPVSGGKRIAYMTSMYATGALVSPLVVDMYLRIGLDWRTLFGFLAVGSAVSFAGIITSGSEPREVRPAVDEEQNGSGKFIFGAILLLSVIMCIYVGFENGFTFFVDTLFTDVLKASTGKIALSVFWAVMIPSRILVGRFASHAEKILITAILMIPATMLLLYICSDPVTVLLLCIPLGFASGAIYPSVLTIMLPYAGRNTATATGIITSATGIGGVVFTAMTGFLADQFGLRAAMLVLVSFFGISLISALSVIKLGRTVKGR
jgi:MFS family permease